MEFTSININQGHGRRQLEQQDRNSKESFSTTLPRNSTRLEIIKTPQDLKRMRLVFKWLPLHGMTNDMLIGSWYFLVGSILSALFPLVPLFDLYFPDHIWPVLVRIRSF